MGANDEPRTITAGDDPRSGRGPRQPSLHLALAIHRPLAPLLRIALKGLHEIEIGRAAETGWSTLGAGRLSLKLADPRLSSQHARLVVTLGRWVVVDAGSKKGTLVNGARAAQTPLDDGDLLELGQTFFTFREHEAGAVSAERVAEIDGAADVPGLATTLPELSAARRRLGVIARSQVPLMIAGETGTGKDVDLRVLSATHRPLEQMIEAGEFRADLHGRLSGHRIALLPLRARREDLGLLVAALLRRLAGDRAATFTLQPRAAGALLSDRWPGNIRELERVLAAAVVLASDGVITMDHLPKALGTAPPPPAPAAPAEVSAPAFLPLLDEVEALERTRMSEALAASGGNQTRAAALIGMPLRTFQIKHEQYGLGGKGR